MQKIFIRTATSFFTIIFLCSAKPSHSMEFSYAYNGGNCFDCKWIKAEGFIDKNTPEDFRKFIKDEIYEENIVFNSEGGTLNAAIELGKIIRQYGMNTSVGKTVLDTSDSDKLTISMIEKGRCISACVIAFLGGVNRTAQEGEIAINQFLLDYELINPNLKNLISSDPQLQQLIKAYFIDYLNNMGVSPHLIQMATDLQPNSNKYLSDSELKENKIIINENEFMDWKLNLTNTNKIFAISTNNNQTLEAYLFCSNSSNINLAIYNSRWDKDTFFHAFKDVRGITAFGTFFSKDKVSAKISNHKTGIEIKLPQNIQSLITTDKQNMEAVWPESSRAISYYFSYKLNVNKIAKIIQIVQKNCQ